MTTKLLGVLRNHFRALDLYTNTPGFGIRYAILYVIGVCAMLFLGEILR